MREMYLQFIHHRESGINPLKPELYPICYLLALLAHDFLHVSRIRVNDSRTNIVVQPSVLLRMLKLLIGCNDLNDYIN